MYLFQTPILLAVRASCLMVVCAIVLSCHGSRDTMVAAPVDCDHGRAIQALRALESDSSRLEDLHEFISQEIRAQRMSDDHLTELINLFVHGDDHAFPGTEQWSRKYTDLYLYYCLSYELDIERDHAIKQISPLIQIDYPAQAYEGSNVWVDTAESWARVRVTPLAQWRGFNESMVRAQASVGGRHIRLGEVVVRPVSGCIWVPVPILDPGKFPVSFSVETGLLDQAREFHARYALYQSAGVIEIVKTPDNPRVNAVDTEVIRSTIADHDWIRIHKLDGENEYEIAVNPGDIRSKDGLREVHLSLRMELVHDGGVLWRSFVPGAACERLFLEESAFQELSLRITGTWWRPGRSTSLEYRNRIVYWKGALNIELDDLRLAAD